MVDWHQWSGKKLGNTFSNLGASCTTSSTKKRYVIDLSRCQKIYKVICITLSMAANCIQILQMTLCNLGRSTKRSPSQNLQTMIKPHPTWGAHVLLPGCVRGTTRCRWPRLAVHAFYISTQVPSDTGKLKSPEVCSGKYHATIYII